MDHSLFEDLLEPCCDHGCGHHLDKNCKKHHCCKPVHKKLTPICPKPHHHDQCNCSPKKPCDHHDQCDCKSKKPCHHHKPCDCGTCEENLNCFILEAAHIENALANAINAESQLVLEGKLSADKLENLIKLAIKKEIVLELLLEDIIKECNECKK